MHRSVEYYVRHALLALVYALGITGILASTSSGGGSGSSFCDLIVRGIAPTIDGSDDVWVGVLAKTDDGSVDRVSRLAANGTERFGVDIAIGNDVNSVRAIAIAVEGAHTNDLYVGGDFSEGILRLNDDGSIDNAFDVGTGFNGRVTSIVPAAGTNPAAATFGDIYVGGYFTTFRGNPVSGLVRLNADGTLDTGFGNIGARVSSVESVAMQGGGSTDVYSGGTIIPSPERWASNGTEDTTPNFDAFTLGINPVFSVTPALGVSTDVYVGGGFSQGIIRLTEFGAPVGSFVVTSGFDDGDVAAIVRTEIATHIYAGGEFTTYEDSSANGIIRLNSLGARVGSFIVGTGFDDPRDTSGGSQVVSLALATDASNDLFVGGGFTRYKGTDVNGLARLNSSGSLIATFEVDINAGGPNCDNSSIDN